MKNRRPRLSPNKIREINERLPWGGKTKIAKNLGLTHAAVSKVLNGKYWDINILMEAKRVIEEYENEVLPKIEELENF